MGMDINLSWPDRPQPPGGWGSDSPEAKAWWRAHLQLSRIEHAGAHGYIRVPYWSGGWASDSTWPGTYVDHLIAEALSSDALVTDEKGEVIAGNLFEAHIPATILRERAAGLSCPDGEEAEVIDAWVSLAERLEADGLTPTIQTCT